jgi:hypothetical protein
MNNYGRSKSSMNHNNGHILQMEKEADACDLADPSFFGRAKSSRPLLSALLRRLIVTFGVGQWQDYPWMAVDINDLVRSFIEYIFEADEPTILG